MAKLEETSIEFGLQPAVNFTGKTVQLWETIVVRHGLMTVGFPPCGKTSCKDVLAKTLEKIADGGDLFMPVVQYANI
jgi:dynein heavy chain, axonemal